MSKSFYFILFMCWSVAPAHAQKAREEETFVRELHTKTISLNDDTKIKSGNLPFKSVTIIDARFDTSMVGLYESEVLAPLSKIVCDDNAASSITNYIDAHYTLASGSNNAPSLLVLLKKLWLSSALDAGFKNGDPDSHAWSDGVIFSCDLFMQNGDSLHTLFRVDTILTGKYSSLNTANLYIEQGIQTMLARVIDRSIQEIHSGTKLFTMNAIQQFIYQYHNYKILIADTLKKGVYASFSEFKNNSPSYPEYETKESNKTDNVYIKDEKGNFVLSRDCWGYCDGQSVFVNSSENIFQLHRSGNTYIMYGFKEFDKRKNIKIGNMLTLGLVAGVVGSQNKKIVYKGDSTPLQLDMETGEFY